jgi:uncharacterized ubiquitin-like protein YukD
MDRVIVTVDLNNNTTSQDLEVPAYMPARDLAQMIMRVLSPGSTTADTFSRFKIKAEPPGRVLEDNETLAEAGVWDGSYITIIW